MINKFWNLQGLTYETITNPDNTMEYMPSEPPGHGDETFKLD